MSAKKPPYPAEFRRQAVALVQRNPDKSIPDLAQELGVSHQSLRNWLKQEDIDRGVRSDGLTTAERQELAQLRRDNKRLAEDREILKKAAAQLPRWRAGRGSSVPIHRCGQGQPFSGVDVPGVGCVTVGLLRVGASWPVGSRAVRRRTAHPDSPDSRAVAGVLWCAEGACRVA
jgi:transposase